MKRCLECNKRFVTENEADVFCKDTCGIRWKGRQRRITDATIKDVECRGCSLKFTSTKIRSVWCSDLCRDAHNKRDSEGHLSKMVIGSVHELSVCVDLLRRGWWVFRSLTPDGPIDVMAIRGSVTLKIQVRKGKRTERGRLYYVKDVRRNKNYSKPDVFAVSLIDGSIVYIPNLPN